MSASLCGRPIPAAWPTRPSTRAFPTAAPPIAGVRSRKMRTEPSRGEEGQRPVGDDGPDRVRAEQCRAQAVQSPSSAEPEQCRARAVQSPSRAQAEGTGRGHGPRAQPDGHRPRAQAEQRTGRASTDAAGCRIQVESQNIKTKSAALLTLAQHVLLPATSRPAYPNAPTEPNRSPDLACGVGGAQYGAQRCAAPRAPAWVPPTPAGPTDRHRTKLEQATIHARL